MCDYDKEQVLSAVVDALGRSKNVILCGHVMPDGDCIGSVLALGRALKKMGKKVVLLSPDPVPEMYAFLPGASDIQINLTGQEEFDTFVVMDCSVPNRLGRYKNLLDQAERVIVLDHHAGATVFGHIYLNESGYAATGELVYELLQMLPVVVDLKMAECLYVAMVTDTGSFSYDNTRLETHLIVAELLRLGIQAAYINKLLYEEKPLISLKILGVALQTLNVSDCGKVAWMSVNRSTIKQMNASDEHVDGFINYPRMIKGVELALFFREMEEGKYKVSLRSKYFLDVNKLASRFGGGGHIRAAGCIMEGDLVDIQRRLLKIAINALKDENK